MNKQTRFYHRASIPVTAAEDLIAGVAVSMDSSTGLFKEIQNSPNRTFDGILPAGHFIGNGTSGFVPAEGIVSLPAPGAINVNDSIYVDRTSGALGNLAPSADWLFIGSAVTAAVNAGDPFTVYLRPSLMTIPPIMMFTSRGDSNSVANTVTETLFDGSGGGVSKVFTLPANTLQYGQSLVIRAGGVYATNAGADQPLRIRLRVDGVAGNVYFDTGANMKWGNGLSGRGWAATVVLVTVGSPSQNISAEQAMISIGKDDGTTGTGGGSVVTSGFSSLSTAQHTFCFSAQWNAASVSSSIRQTYMSAELLPPANTVL